STVKIEVSKLVETEADIKLIKEVESSLEFNEALKH
ncbi:MAG: hypothetical protein ACI8WT_005091, partial [Clostridium sp.]